MTESDRELLELAAKAAGVRLFVWGAKGAENICLKLDDNTPGPRWNPLTDDGDALRMAVELKLEFEWWKNGVSIGRDDLPPAPIEHSGADPYAATRRAIVRAAAAIATNKEGA